MKHVGYICWSLLLSSSLVTSHINHRSAVLKTEMYATVHILAKTKKVKKKKKKVFSLASSVNDSFSSWILLSLGKSWEQGTACTKMSSVRELESKIRLSESQDEQVYIWSRNMKSTVFMLSLISLYHLNL